MGVQIHSYNWPADEFTELEVMYPTGRYNHNEGTHWFTVHVTTDAGIVQLTWFKED